MTTHSENPAEEPQSARKPLQNGRVLVVDDMQVNLYVAEKLLSSYGLNVDLAVSGLDAIKKVDSGNSYDIIFMDHKMPQMDGFEATAMLRGNGYKGVIVALTGDSPGAEGEEDFKQNGFDASISKPINIGQMEAVLYKYIHTAPTPGAQPHEETLNPLFSPKLLQIFCIDAEKAAVTLRETAAAGNIKRYTIAIHALKSALASLGEDKASEQASLLELAGTNGNLEYIKGNTESFLKTLEALVKKLCPEGYSETDDDIDEPEEGFDPIGQLQIDDKSKSDPQSDKPKTFLLIDDSRFMRRTIKSILVRNGFKVIGEAGNGAAGVEKYKALNPDVVTLDHNMDEKTGLEALELIMKHNPDANVIMISGMMGQGIVAREALDKGAKAVIEKPVDEKALLREIKKIFKNKS